MRRSTLLLLVLAACTTEEAPPPLTVATYNAGLAVGFVAGAEDRATRLADDVAGLDAELVCLQEVWRAEDVARLADAAPHQHVVDAAPETVTGACEAGELDAFRACVDDSCGDACSDELVDCALGSCALQFIGLSKSCQGCVQANVGEGDAATLQASCEGEGPVWAYGGSFGIGLLSEHPLTGIEELVLDSTTNRRAVIHAVAQAPLGDVDVYCTHLSAVFAVIPYPRETGSWAEEQAAQIEALHAWIDETATTGRTMLLGDLNTGPAGASFPAEVPESWALLEARGWDDPYATLVGECTYCGDNPLVGGTAADDRLIDHVLLEGDLTGTAADRVADTLGTAVSCGVPFDAPPSDHYGVRVVVERPVSE